MRATRDLLRCRLHLTRHRAALLAPSPKTHSPDHRPEMGQKIAYQATRDGVGERCSAPAVQQSVEVDLPLIGGDDPWLSDGELTSVQTATQHAAHPWYRLPSLPGIGKMLRVVRLYELPDLRRVPRVQDVVSSGRLGPCAQDSAGKRSGTSGATIGHADLKGACSEAAGLLLRNNPVGQTYLTRLEKNHGQGQALTVFAPT